MMRKHWPTGPLLASPKAPARASRQITPELGVPQFLAPIQLAHWLLGMGSPFLVLQIGSPPIVAETPQDPNVGA